MNVNKMNIGCGATWKDDWINIDNSPVAFIGKHKLIQRLFSKIGILPKNLQINVPKDLVLRDVRKGLPFKNNTINFIFTSHFLEHLTYFEGRELIQECYRVAAPGAVIRIVVPDVELLARKYLERDSVFNASIAKDRLSGWVFEGRELNEIGFAEILSIQFYAAQNITNFWVKLMTCILYGQSIFNIRKKIVNYYHKWMYDFESLKLLLEYTGFRNVRRCEFREGKVPDLDVLDNHEEFSLYVEADKMDASET